VEGGGDDFFWLSVFELGKTDKEFVTSSPSVPAVLTALSTMPDPTKEQIQEIFKKLKSNRYNKVHYISTFYVFDNLPSNITILNH
jgi:ABC-type phosphate/phosphonate transport system substrate-binding protein